MSFNLSGLLQGDLDPETVERLRVADPAEIRALLERYLSDEEVDAVLERIERLLGASPTE